MARRRPLRRRGGGRRDPLDRARGSSRLPGLPGDCPALPTRRGHRSRRGSRDPRSWGRGRLAGRFAVGHPPHRCRSGSSSRALASRSAGHGSSSCMGSGTPSRLDARDRHESSRTGDTGRCFPDLRGHGRSTGEWLTFGPLEGRRISRRSPDGLARSRSRSRARSGVYGPSFGGAAAFLLVRRARDPRVRAVVTVSTFPATRSARSSSATSAESALAVRSPASGSKRAIDRIAGLIAGSTRSGRRRPPAAPKRGPSVSSTGRLDPPIPWEREAPELRPRPWARAAWSFVPGENHRTIFAGPDGDDPAGGDRLVRSTPPRRGAAASLSEPRPLFEPAAIFAADGARD